MIGAATIALALTATITLTASAVGIYRIAYSNEEEEVPPGIETSLLDRTLAPSLKRRAAGKIYTADDWESAVQEWEDYIGYYKPEIRDISVNMTGHVTFSDQLRLVGHIRTGAKEVGVDLVEVPYPTDTFLVRPIRSQDEWPLLLPSETVLPPTILRSRVLTGEALVQVYAESRPIMEDVYEPEFESVHQVLHVLWDCSPSMFAYDHSTAWRTLVWQALMIRLMSKALRNGVPLYVRRFGGYCSEVIKIYTYSQAMDFRNQVLFDYRSISSTDIGGAIRTGLEDFDGGLGGHMVLVTDGEDNGGLWPDEVRESLGDVKLHALMLGVENDTLKECCDQYQVVQSNLILHRPVVRGAGT